MRAVRLHRYGPPHVLVLDRCPIPIPSPDEVVIRVGACAISALDLLVRAGRMAVTLPRRLPAILGWDVAGSVLTAGAGVAGWRVGDRVMALADISRDGGYAEYMAVAQDRLAPMPDGLDFLRAAALPTPATLADEAVHGVGRLGPGETVVVVGAEGDTGRLTVQLARRVPGTTVVGIVPDGPPGRDIDVGADLQLTEDEVGRASVRAALVIDFVGGPLGQACRRLVRPGGRVVVGSAPWTAAYCHGLELRRHARRLDPDRLYRLAAEVAAGTLSPMPVENAALDLAPEIHALGESGRWIGKVVLVPGRTVQDSFPPNRTAGDEARAWGGPP